MLEFGNTIYYLDLEVLNRKISIASDKVTKQIEKKTTYDSQHNPILFEVTENTIENDNGFDMAKYELLKIMIEFIMDYNQDIDEALGADRGLNDTTLSYKIIFNTLINQGILKEK